MQLKDRGSFLSSMAPHGQPGCKSHQSLHGMSLIGRVPWSNQMRECSYKEPSPARNQLVYHKSEFLSWVNQGYPTKLIYFVSMKSSSYRKISKLLIWTKMKLNWYITKKTKIQQKYLKTKYEQQGSRLIHNFSRVLINKSKI